MNKTLRPDGDLFYMMGRKIQGEIGDAHLVIIPVDHGAYSDSVWMRPFLKEAGVNATYYMRGPYTWRGSAMEYFVKLHNLSYPVERDHCVDQTNFRRFGEYRLTFTPLKEPLAFLRLIGGADYLMLWEDSIGEKTASSGLGAYVYAATLAKCDRSLKGFFLAASRDFSGGLAHFAAERIPAEKTHETPEHWIQQNAPRTWEYLVENGIIDAPHIEQDSSPCKIIPFDSRKPDTNPMQTSLVTYHRLLKRPLRRRN